MIRIIFTVILALLNIISFSQNVSNVSVKQVDGNIQLIFDLNKSVTTIEVLYSQFGDEYKVLKEIKGGLTTKAGKSKQITLTPDFFFCNSCSFRIRAYDNLLIDSRDGKTYSTISVNNKIWMAENLNYIPQSGISVCPDLDLYEGCKIYGRLYDYQTAKSVCPNGWRLPKEADWDELIEFAGGKDIAVKKLKSPPPLWSGASSTEVLFNALPSGFANRSPDNKLHTSSFSSSAYWWASLGENSSKGLCFYLFDTFLGASFNYPADFYLSVRCLKDNYK